MKNRISKKNSAMNTRVIKKEQDDGYEIFNCEFMPAIVWKKWVLLMPSPEFHNSFAVGKIFCVIPENYFVNDADIAGQINDAALTACREIIF